MKTLSAYSLFILLLIMIIPCLALGQCLDGDCQQGEGKYRFKNPDCVYSGSFQNGLPNGKGELTYTTFNVKFSGYFIDGELDSSKKGLFRSANYSLDGFVTEVVESTEEGDVYSWVLNGIGEKNIGQGDQVEKGYFVGNVLNDSNAEIKYRSGNRYLGGVVNGKRQGKGKIITPSGGIQQDGTWYDDEWIDRNDNNPYSIPLSFDGGSLLLEVSFNGAKVPMVLDSGASIVTINQEVFYALVRLGSLKIKDASDGSFRVANGDIIPGTIYTIYQMSIGEFKLENVECSVLDSSVGSNLFGLNALLKPTGSFSVDISKMELRF